MWRRKVSSTVDFATFYSQLVEENGMVSTVAVSTWSINNQPKVTAFGSSSKIASWLQTTLEANRTSLSMSAF